MKVINRSDSTVTYSLPELNTRRSFSPGESKELSPQEMEALFQKQGGAQLIKDYLLVDDRDWVAEHWDAPIEYFWQAAQVRKCLLEDPIDLFTETLDYAPAGVIDIIKSLAWRTPISDLNKIGAIKEKTGFDVLLAIEVMKPTAADRPQAQAKPQRRRREEV